MGFPIRKCPDQSLFAAPRTLSQRTTSFIASQRQGIHRIPLRHLIVLMNNARPLPIRSAAAGPLARTSGKQQPTLSERPVIACRTRPDAKAVKPGSSAARGPWDGFSAFRTCSLSTMSKFFSVLDRSLPIGSAFIPNENFMQDELVTEVSGWSVVRPLDRLVEPDGIEPTTSCLQSTRSPN